MTDKKRWELNETLKVFISSYKYIIPSYEHKVLSNEDLLSIWQRNQNINQQRLECCWDVEVQALVIFLYPDSNENNMPVRGFIIRSRVNLLPEDIKFAESFANVFNLDISMCEDIDKTDETWRTLRLTQFLRAISRFTNFKSLSVSRWIQTMESSMFLTYEGKQVKHVIFLPYRFESTVKKLQVSYVKLIKSLTIEEALLEEKWVRTIVDGRRVALLANKKNGGSIAGFISLSEIKKKKKHIPYIPHESLEDIQSLLEKNDMAFIAAISGDIWLLLGSGLVFNRAQGMWRYLNYNHLYQILIKHINEPVTNAIINTALNLSFERKGALICVITTKAPIRYIVPDTDKENQANYILRKSLKGLDITNDSDKQLLISASTIDGAVVLDEEGKVIDIACMIGKANEKRMKELDIEEARIFSGARTTAAWKASLFGLSVKVSSDGQIVIFYEGKVIWGEHWL